VKQLVHSIFKYSIAVCILFLYNSCQKSTPVDSNTTAAQDHIMVETHADDIVNIGAEASYGAMATYRLIHPSNIMYVACATITVNNVVPTNNDTMIVNFGTSCVGQDGRTRSGSLQYIYTGGLSSYLDSSNVINVSANNYIVDGNTISIVSETIQNMGHITNGNLTYNITANLNVTKSGGGNIQCTSNETKVLIAGEQPNNLPILWTQAQIVIYGTSKGTSADGESFTANIPQATWLVRNFNCTSYRKCFVAGIEDFNPGTKPTRYINFGTGTCDNQAVITINGYLFTETLP
jgi:hypothetical protein